MRSAILSSGVLCLLVCATTFRACFSAEATSTTAPTTAAPAGAASGAEPGSATLLPPSAEQRHPSETENVETSLCEVCLRGGRCQDRATRNGCRHEERNRFHCSCCKLCKHRLSRRHHDRQRNQPSCRGYRCPKRRFQHHKRRGRRLYRRQHRFRRTAKSGGTAGPTVVENTSSAPSLLTAEQRRRERRVRRRERLRRKKQLRRQAKLKKRKLQRLQRRQRRLGSGGGRPSQLAKARKQRQLRKRRKLRRKKKRRLRKRQKKRQRKLKRKLKRKLNRKLNRKRKLGRGHSRSFPLKANATSAEPLGNGSEPATGSQPFLKAKIERRLPENVTAACRAAQVQCPSDQICVVNIQNLPVCRCISEASCARAKRRSLVCASDGRTYLSRCHLMAARCAAAVDPEQPSGKVSVQRAGECVAGEGERLLRQQSQLRVRARGGSRRQRRILRHMRRSEKQRRRRLLKKKRRLASKAAAASGTAQPAPRRANSGRLSRLMRQRVLNRSHRR